MAKAVDMGTRLAQLEGETSREGSTAWRLVVAPPALATKVEPEPEVVNKASEGSGETMHTVHGLKCLTTCGAASNSSAGPPDWAAVPRAPPCAHGGPASAGPFQASPLGGSRPEEAPEGWVCQIRPWWSACLRGAADTSKPTRSRRGLTALRAPARSAGRCSWSEIAWSDRFARPRSGVGWRYRE